MIIAENKNNCRKIDLSVIVANYNNEEYIEDCLNSITNQTFKNVEIIVVDDCSTDNSVFIVKKYMKKYPDMIFLTQNKSNKGVAFSRNIGIMMAKGEYLTTLDSDDYYIKNDKLFKEMELVKTYRTNYERDIIAFSHTVLVNRHKSFVEDKSITEVIKEGDIFEDILTRKCHLPLDFVYKRDMYHEVGGYDMEFKLFEDWDIKIRLARKYCFYYTGNCGTAYRRHRNGLSSSSSRDIRKYLWKAFNKNITLVANVEVQSELRWKFIKQKMYNRLRSLKRITRELFINWKMRFKDKIYSK